MIFHSFWIIFLFFTFPITEWEGLENDWMEWFDRSFSLKPFIHPFNRTRPISSLALMITIKGRVGFPHSHAPSPPLPVCVWMITRFSTCGTVPIRLSSHSLHSHPSLTSLLSPSLVSSLLSVLPIYSTWPQFSYTRLPDYYKVCVPTVKVFSYCGCAFPPFFLSLLCEQ